MEVTMIECEWCGKRAVQMRATKRFCSQNCSNKSSRVRQNAATSPTKRREEEEYWDKVNYGFELFMQLDVADRDPWMQKYIDDPRNKKIVCNPKLLGHRHLNIAKLANSFTQSKYGKTILKYYDFRKES